MNTTTRIEGASTEKLKQAVLNKVYEMDCIQVLHGYELLAAKHLKTNAGIYVINGNFGRKHFKKAIAEAKAAGVNPRRVYVYGESATYSGPAICFSKFEEIGLQKHEVTRLEQPEAARKLNCYIQAKGEPCEPEDEEVPGFYLIELSLSRPLVLGSISDQDRSEIATATLDSFHEHQGIENLDTFLISVLLEDGTKAQEGEFEASTGLVLNAEHCGKLDIAELPLEVRA